MFVWKDSEIIFAFIEFDSSDSAEKTIQRYSKLLIWMKFSFHQLIFYSMNILILVWMAIILLVNRLKFNLFQEVVIVTIEVIEEDSEMIVDAETLMIDLKGALIVKNKDTLPVIAPNVKIW